MTIRLDVKSEGLDVDFDALIENVLKEAMNRIERRTPVRSGALQAGWELEKSKGSYQITNKQDYAIYVEEGTATTPPVGMVRTTMEELQQITDDEVSKINKRQ